MLQTRATSLGAPWRCACIARRRIATRFSPQVPGVCRESRRGTERRARPGLGFALIVPGRHVRSPPARPPAGPGLPRGPGPPCQRQQGRSHGAQLRRQARPPAAHRGGTAPPPDRGRPSSFSGWRVPTRRPALTRAPERPPQGAPEATAVLSTVIAPHTTLRTKSSGKGPPYSLDDRRKDRQEPAVLKRNKQLCRRAALIELRAQLRWQQTKHNRERMLPQLSAAAADSV